MRFCLSLLALCAVLVSLTGCVIVPDGYYDRPYHHHHDWGDRGWHDRWDDRH